MGGLACVEWVRVYVWFVVVWCALSHNAPTEQRLWCRGLSYYRCGVHCLVLQGLAHSWGLVQVSAEGSMPDNDQQQHCWLEALHSHR